MPSQPKFNARKEKVVLRKTPKPLIQASFVPVDLHTCHTKTPDSRCGCKAPETPHATGTASPSQPPSRE
eukprot:2835799-Amphidinium_carterae.1